jgi:hypothetical protein
MAENRTINIKINQNADKAEQSFKSYNKELGNTKKQYDAVLKSGKPFDQQLEDINRIVKETPLNVRDMNKQIQAYQSIALSAGRETPVGKQALEQAAQLRDRYVDIQNETKRLADDQRNLEGAMQGLSTGIAIYGGIQSVMALTGVESEKYRETLVKLQAAQTLLNSINQTATALEKESALMLLLKGARTKAATAATAAYGVVTGTTTGLLKAFRIALASTGIGLLVVGIGLLIANFKKLIEVFDPAIDGLKDFADWIGLTNFAEEEREEARIKRAQAEIERQNKLFELRKQNFSEEQKAFDRRIALIQAEGKESGILDQLKELNQIKQSKRDIAYAQGQIQRLRLLKRKLDGQSEEAKELEQQIDAFSKAIRESNQQIADSNNQLKINTINANKEKAKSYKQYLKDIKDLDKQIQDAQLQLQKDGIEKDLEANRIKFERQREQIKGNGEKQKELRALLVDLELKAEQEIRLKYFNEEKEILSGIVNFRDELRNKEIEDNKKAADSIIKTNEKARQQDLKNEKIAADAKQKLREAQIANVEAGIALFKDIAGENKKLQAIGIAAESAASIAKTIITTQAANAAATAQGAALAIPTLGASVAAAAAAVTQNNISAGISIAAQIAAAAKGISALGGGASAPSGSAPSGGGAGGDVISPEFNVVGESGINQLAQLQQQPVQAYVVSGEVTTGQALDRNRVQNATL